MQKLNLGFNRYSDANLLMNSRGIYAAMLNNGNFVTPQPTLPILLAAIDSYEAALSAAQEGGKTIIATKKARRQELIAMLITLGNYVMLTSDGNLVMLTSCGIELSKQPEPLPPIDNPLITSLEDGATSGDLRATINPVKGARAYVYQYTEDPLTAGSVWTSFSSTLTKFTFTNLQSGKKYWVRVLACGSNNQVTYSDPVARIVQ